MAEKKIRRDCTQETLFLRCLSFSLLRDSATDLVSNPQLLRCCATNLVRFQMVSLEFFSDIILSIALWPWGRLSL